MVREDGRLEGGKVGKLDSVRLPAPSAPRPAQNHIPTFQPSNFPPISTFQPSIHRSFTNRYAELREIPVSAATRSATSLRDIPSASQARARASASAGGATR